MQTRPVVVKLLRSARYDEASKVVAFLNFFANESKMTLLVYTILRIESSPSH